jgi:NAD(P)-dependent dehydrogenase (short-subunit alcohol dehydrogenase family)
MKKTAVITGVAGGIGKATAKVFSEAGWQVVGIDSIGLDSSSGIDHFIRGDISKTEIWVHVSEEIQAKEAGLNALINNAAIQICKPLIDTVPEEWDQIMAVNLRSVYLGIRALYPFMRINRGNRQRVPCMPSLLLQHRSLCREQRGIGGVNKGNVFRTGSGQYTANGAPRCGRYRHVARRTDRNISRRRPNRKIASLAPALLWANR